MHFQSRLTPVSERVRIEHHRDGRLLTWKTAPPGTGRDLHREATVLAEVQVPGVVELVSDASGVGDADAVLVTRWVGPRTLADLRPPLTPDRAAGLCLSVGATIGRLHRCGVVHGAIDPSHVVLDGQGRPVLCGFGSARLMHESPTSRPADDVAGLARLLAHLLGLSDNPAALDRSLRMRRVGRNQRRALALLVAAAVVDDPTCRPSLAAFVHGVRRVVPGASLSSDGARDEQSGRHARRARRRQSAEASDKGDEPEAPQRPVDSVRHRPRSDRDDRSSRPDATRARSLLAMAAVAIVGATTYFGLSAWWADSDATPISNSTSAAISTGTRPAVPTTATTADVPTPSPPTTSSPSPATTLSTPPPTTPAAGASSTVLTTAPVMEHDGRRFEIGQAGDVALVGPWFCDGTEVVALLRPATGSVHVFTGWATADGAIEARTVASLPGAAELRGVADGPGCAVLVVSSATDILRTLTAGDLR